MSPAIRFTGGEQFWPLRIERATDICGAARWPMPVNIIQTPKLVVATPYWRAPGHHALLPRAKFASPGWVGAVVVVALAGICIGCACPSVNPARRLPPAARSATSLPLTTVFAGFQWR